MVPEGWMLTFLKDVMEFKNGLNFTKSDRGEAIKIVGVSNFKHHSELRSTENLDVVNVAQKVRDNELLEDGDLLFVRSNGNKDLIGRCLFFPRVSGKISFSGFTIRGRVNKELVLPEYLSDVTRSPIMKQQISEKGGGTNISNLTQQILGAVSVPLPPVAEQKKITQILSTWDQAITVTERLLENSRQRKKSLMQQLLTGKKRLPGFEGEWEWLKASDIFQTVSKKNNYNQEELLAVTQDQGVLPRSSLERRVVMPDGSTSGYKLVVPGNFIISLRSFQGGLEYSNYRGLVSPAYTVLEPKREICDGFYQQYYKSYDFIGHLAVAVIGIRDGKQISYSDFSFLKLPYPPIQEQKAIADVLSTASREIECLINRLDCLKREKRVLMQQLLTGKRRVQVEAA